MTEYRNEDSDITLVAHDYKYHAPNDIKQEPIKTHATSERIILRTKVLDGYKADYLHEVRNPVMRSSITSH